MGCATALPSCGRGLWLEKFPATRFPRRTSCISPVVYILLRVLKKLPPEKRKFNPDFSFLKKAGNIRLVLAVVWLLVYSWFLPIGGYLVATILFCLGVMALLGSRNIPKMLLGSVCITIALFVIFSWGLRVSLPRGMGPLEDFGKWLEYLV